MELLEEQRENWGSRGGFVLAAVGSAVGLGNLWGFPYKLYSYGGGAFLIPYILAVFAIGIPMLILEFSLGHLTQRAAPEAFKKSHKKLEFVGWWGIILGFVIITYYPVILAYCFSFLGLSIKGIFNGGQLPWAGSGLEGVKNAEIFFYTTYLGYHEEFTLGAVRFNILWPLIITWAAMYFCIFRGVKLVGRIVWLTVPLPWLMLLILAVRGLTLEGSMQGLAYYLAPDWSQLLKPTTWRFAFGQVFFSLSLAFGVMITYASFLHRKSDINNNAAIIGIADFATSFVAGIAIFATLGGMAFATQQGGNPVGVENVVTGGPGLAFVAFPYALAQLPYSAWFSFIFFFALITLGIDSGFSITESVLASIVDKTGWKRCIVLPVMSLVGLGIGIIYITKGGLNWLGTIDGFINGTWGIAFLGLLECFVLGWVYRIDKLRIHANARSDWKLGRWWNYLIRIFIPVVLGSLFIWSLFEDFSNGEFFTTEAGRINWPNCIGLTVVAVAPVIAILISMVKGPRPNDEYLQVDENLVVRGRKSGMAGIILTLISAGLIIVVLWINMPLCLKQMLFLVAGLASISGLIIANFILDRYSRDEKNTKPTHLAKWAGIIATLDISTFLAISLIYIKCNYQPDNARTDIKETVHILTGTSYTILSVVFLLIIGGLGWCFYKTLAAGADKTEIQIPDEIGGQKLN